MTITFEIDSVDKTASVGYDSLTIQSTLSHRDIASFDLLVSSGSYEPDIGDEVLIEEDSDIIFGGTIDRITREPYSESDNGYTLQIECVDYNQLADRFYITENFEAGGQTLHDILVDAANAIVPNYLAADGVTSANVEEGPAIQYYFANDKTATEVFNDLAVITGYAWWIDYDRDLHFISRESNLAPFSLTDSSANFRRLQIEKTRDNYRNRQILKGGVEITASRTESFLGDGTRKTFNLGFPVNAISAVTVNAVAKTYGIRGRDSGLDWYYEQSSNEFTQDDGGTALTGAQTLAVTYTGQFPMKIFVEDGGEVASRVAAEGGSGWYESLYVDQTIRDSDFALAIASGLIRKFRIPTIVKFETDDAGLQPGQLLTIGITSHNLDGQFLISDVRASGLHGSLRYQVTALSGEFQGSWIDFFRSLVVSGSRFGLRDDEVLLIGRTATDTVSLTDVLTPTDAALGSFVYDTAVYGYAEYG